MTTASPWPLSVCSWSLQCPPRELGAKLSELGVSHVHLGLAPFLAMPDALDFIRSQDWTLSCLMLSFDHEDYTTLDTIRSTGGIVPDPHWPTVLERFKQALELSAGLDCDKLSFHAGFIDHHDADAFASMTERVRILADHCRESGISLLLETGQESAEDLAGFLEQLDHETVGVNFDPANMILYDKGDPIDAVLKLAGWIQHVHVKDATRTVTPGTWGEEVPWGDGDVDTEAFLMALSKIGYRGPLAVEREAGSDRMRDISLALDRLNHAMQA